MAVILHGHYRTFSRTHASWSNILMNNDVYFHTWDTISSKSSSHWKNITDTIPLKQEDVYFLKTFNPKYIQIDTQEWSNDELSLIGKSIMPLKAYIYFWKGVSICLDEIIKSGIHYDYILIGRYDVNITKSPNYQVKQGIMFTTENDGAIYKQYTDAIICLHPDDIIVIQKFCSFTNTEEFKNLFVNIQTPEEIFNLYLIWNNIERIKWWSYEDAQIIR